MDPTGGTLFEFVKSFGFPVAVAAWFMVRMEGRLDKISDALRELTVAVRESLRKG